MKRNFPNSIYYNPIAVVKFNSLIEWNYEVIEKRNNLKRLSKLGYKITLSRDSHTLSNPENSHFADFRIFLSFWAAKKTKNRQKWETSGIFFSRGLHTAGYIPCLYKCFILVMFSFIDFRLNSQGCEF